MVEQKRNAIKSHETAEQSGESSTARKVGRGALKAVTKLTAADVFARDIRRIRPRYPQLWKDIFHARSKLKAMREAQASRPGIGTPARVAIRNSGITALVGVAVVFYGMMLISNQLNPGGLSLISKISMSGLIVAGVAQAAIYGCITLKLLQRLRSHPVMPKPAKPTQRSKRT